MEEVKGSWEWDLVQALTVLPRFYLVARKSIGRVDACSGYQVAAVAATDWLGSVTRSLGSSEWRSILAVAHMMGPALDDLQCIVDYSDMAVDEVERGILLILRDRFDTYLARVGWYLPSEDVVKRCLEGAIQMHEAHRSRQVSTVPSKTPTIPIPM